eukprot:CAMPEP_0180146840 /NCGR_PEP_ID=MMETSP0986-20121125/18824_1 /TAXON_ID=697907 /ORGANISM="non described non described, Strain CCMP2293" /LENGTH=74 /DNA_ID=CAMNT_0022092123 /DNA_START=29 /DNA_END=253 /DNA_ORIENTATION=-
MGEVTHIAYRRVAWISRRGTALLESLLSAQALQGYLADQKAPPPRTLQRAYAYGPTMGPVLPGRALGTRARLGS